MWQFDGQCYATPQAANEAAASAVSGTVQGAYALSAVSVSDTSITWQAIDMSTGAVLMRVVAVDPQPCGLLTRDDALSLSWGTVGVWVSVAAVLFLARTIWHGVVNHGAQGDS